MCVLAHLLFIKTLVLLPTLRVVADVLALQTLSAFSFIDWEVSEQRHQPLQHCHLLHPGVWAAQR